jgi:hypothetical protein
MQFAGVLVLEEVWYAPRARVEVESTIHEDLVQPVGIVVAAEVVVVVEVVREVVDDLVVVEVVEVVREVVDEDEELVVEVAPDVS